LTSISKYFDKNLTISTSLQALQMKGLWWDIDSSLCWPKWNSVKPQFKISQRTNMDSLSIYELLFHLVSWTLATESSWALDWCTWSTHASNVFQVSTKPHKAELPKTNKIYLHRVQTTKPGNHEPKDVRNLQWAICPIICIKSHSESSFKLF